MRPLSSRRGARRLGAWLLLALSVGAAVAATASVSSGGAGANAVGGTGRVQIPNVAPRAAVTELDDQLSTTQLAGQRIIYSYSGLTPPATLLARIRSGEAAGVIFFTDNIASRAQLSAVVAELQRANASSPVHVPLLLMTDQEGGFVRRLSGAPELSEAQIGESPDGVALAADAGSGAGANLRSVGLNVNLAPVLDVARTPDGFDGQDERSYGPSPSSDAALASAFIAAQQQTGVAATAKHFPGLGAAAATQNTDAQPVTLDLSLAALRGIDELPFHAAIAAGVKLVMVSWAVYPAFHTTLPAGLSESVIQGELRGRLGFQGVTITDALTAGALDAFGSLGARGVLAARAGADLLLCTQPNSSNSPLSGTLVWQALVTSLADGQLSRVAAGQSVARVVALRQGL